MFETDNCAVVKTIWQMKKKGAYKRYISEISFPHFKNLERGLTIQFDFPVTALIGPNGINKSSILRALQACPGSNSISDYWFDTDLDYIESEPNDRQRYIHRYRVPSGNVAEVIKIRTQKHDRGKDYFETAKPRISDGMHAMPEMVESDRPYRANTRWKPIDKKVIYIDFRSQLPAFDIFMSYQHRKDKRDAASRKKHVRLRAGRLNKAIKESENSSVICGSERLLSDVIVLTDKELEDVSCILGRQYESIKMVKHDFYDFEGWTAKLKTKDYDYSEAFAGSGEFAAVMIVHALHSADKESLVLLDEPETSLHPGAQLALCSFLLKMAKEKQLQIIMATHSREIIRDLPPEGRKLLGIVSPKTEVSLLSANASLEEAFARLGARFLHTGIYVEDELSAELLKSAFRERGTDAVQATMIVPFPGGADTIMTKLVPVLAATKSNALVVLDGDRRVTCDDSVAPPNGEKECLSLLKRYNISKQHIPMNGGNDVDETHIVEPLRNTLTWIWDHVFYLPGSDPEGLLLSMVEDTPLDTSNNSKKNKTIWAKRARVGYSKTSCEQISSEEILNYQKIELSKALRRNANETASQVLSELSTIVDRFLE